MKLFKIIICIIVALLGGTLMEASANNAEVSQSQTTQQSQWIEIGEVTLYHLSSRDSQKAILYVMQLGDKFIYRIQWHSNFYTVNKHESTSYNSHNAQVILPVSEFYYYLNVPQW